MTKTAHKIMAVVFIPSEWTSIAVSTNDALSSSAASIGMLMARRGMFFVPFEQDDYRSKPTSCVADFDKILPAAEAALEGRQLQPVLA